MAPEHATLSLAQTHDSADAIPYLLVRRMEEALVATGGMQPRAAGLIGTPIRTFGMKLRQCGLEGRRAR